MCLIKWLFEDPPQFDRDVSKKKRRKVEARGTVRQAHQPEKQKPTGLHTFSIVKAYCCPAWPIVSKALERYSIPITDYTEQTVPVSGAELRRIPSKETAYKDVPMATSATFSVPNAQAKWAEYLLWSTGRLIVTAGHIDKRNQQLGERRAGLMPLPWDAKAATDRAVKIAKRPTEGPWLESDCKQGQLLWKEANLKAKKGKAK